MIGTILGFPEVQNTVRMETSKQKNIINSQNRRIDQKSIDYELHLKLKWGAAEEFQGESTSVYNCHGLTFASKRTGIFSDEVIELILDDEYQEIENSKVVVGDIVLYFSYDKNNKRTFEHSALVVGIGNIIGGGTFNIRVLSKTRFYKEIVHYVVNHPYTGTEFKFYRIKHDPITILK